MEHVVKFGNIVKHAVITEQFCNCFAGHIAVQLIAFQTENSKNHFFTHNRISWCILETTVITPSLILWQKNKTKRNQKHRTNFSLSGAILLSYAFFFNSLCKSCHLQVFFRYLEVPARRFQRLFSQWKLLLLQFLHR